MDRFLMKEVLTYPTPPQELEILQRIATGQMTRPLTAQPISLDDVRFLRGLVDDVYVDDSIKRYVVDLINTTRFSARARCRAWTATCAWARRRAAASRSCAWARRSRSSRAGRT